MFIFLGGYCLALDMTARDFQNEAKRGGLPWTMAKVLVSISLDNIFIQRYILSKVDSHGPWPGCLFQSL
jgi:hypothetical protein